MFNSRGKLLEKTMVRGKYNVFILVVIWFRQRIYVFYLVIWLLNLTKKKIFFFPAFLLLLCHSSSVLDFGFYPFLKFVDFPSDSWHCILGVFMSLAFFSSNCLQPVYMRIYKFQRYSIYSQSLFFFFPSNVPDLLFVFR